MKRDFITLLIMLSIMLITCSGLRASHIMGGEITYSWVSGNSYQVTLSLYRDCSGINAPTSAMVNISSASCGISGLTANLFPTSSSPTIITPACPSLLTTCNGGSLVGVEKWDYSGTVTLPSACNDWIISRQECCRNSSITNLTNASSQPAMFTAELNNLDFPFNNSVQFSNHPIFFLSTGTTHTMNNGIYDVDGDSIVMELAPARSNINTFIPYNPGYDHLNPVFSNPASYLNQSTGDFVVSPVVTEVDVIVYQITEYRNGIMVGRTSRDVQVSITNFPNNLPQLSGVNGSNNFYSNLCAGDTLRFMVYSADADTSDSTFISLSGIPGMSISSFGGQQDSVLVEFITDTTMVSSSPYLLHLNVSDNACPYFGRQSYTYRLFVNSCTADVWPGDANSDLQCNMYDVLSIGLAFNATGPVRPAATTNWVAESASAWSQDFISGVNYKHADCNGDGIIDAQDTLVIAQNYGLSHPLRVSSLPPSGIINSIYLSASRDSAGPSDSFRVQVGLGSSAFPVSPIYGIAFRLHFSSALVDSTLSGFSFVSSNFGTPGNDIITFTKFNWAAGYVDAVSVRNNQQNSLADSTVGILDVVIVDNISARAVSRFSLSNVRGITADGLEHYFNVVNDSVSIYSSTTGISRAELNNISVYPNPAKSELFINPAGMNVSKISITDLAGRVVVQNEYPQAKKSIDISTLSEGVYILNIHTPNGVAQRKIQVIK